MATYLVLNYSGEGPQSDKDWTALFSRLEAAKALRGGSALGKRLGFDGTSDVAVTAREVGGYFIISALRWMTENKLANTHKNRTEYAIVQKDLALRNGVRVCKDPIPGITPDDQPQKGSP